MDCAPQDRWLRIEGPTIRQPSLPEGRRLRGINGRKNLDLLNSSRSKGKLGCLEGIVFLLSLLGV